ncbi:hypothetical protein W97_07377 [Coniosporium apollinis CBS 100218]|uniref:histidine kinase n=1 Tax=Coniosporium apollinis (strain CBS 100218) TaxID=1168221 RepID=R7Z0Z9_CONA1|nr:uncharacterized protein W97_07377 [Coniosporium apollinis CBS 100218]EON67880.1 hypothetical protein W97_07377 [Coniosporium apollinis CBS 100218]
MRPPLPSPSTRTPQPTASASQAAPRPALQPTEGRPSSASRPPLQRQSPSIVPGRDDENTPRPNPLPAVDSSVSTDDSSAESDISSGADEGTEEDEVSTNEGAGPLRSSRPVPGIEEARLQRLREAVNAKLSLAQQQARFGSINMAASTGSLGARRVSPIKEEDPRTISPSLDASFSSPLPTGAQSSSTQSTESQRTIRGSVPATPAQLPVRTPSYPFPYVPGTPRTWSSSFHQPFTALSPTIDALHTRDTATPRERTMSGASTPAGSGATFMPPGTSQSALEDPRYPSPNMYDLVLLLNSEPGLDAWWSSVVKIMHENYGAQRVTLAVPADAADIENVPWGQKATFNAAARGELWPPSDSSEEKLPDAPRLDSAHNSLRKAEDEDTLPAAFSALRNRPKLVSRHSFAGHERQRRDLSTEYDGAPARFTRPRAPLRTVSHAPQTTPRTEVRVRSTPLAQMDPSPQNRPNRMKESTFSDPDFSSLAGDAATEPYAAVFPVLRALDHEADALIDTTGINRILERGKLVTLTRDYSSPAPSHRRASDLSSGSETAELPTNPPTRSQGQQTLTEPRASQPSRDIRSRTTNPAPSTGVEVENRRLSISYQEYEQFPSSPWAQSPAPSPAIQADPEDNPFFATTNVDEESFNPTEVAQDYSRFDPVEAIGIDRASTLTHLPLFHPSLSQIMEAGNQESPLITPGVRQGARDERRSDATVTTERSGFQRRAPIAILSLLSSTVPYPQNLTQSLKMLGPHFATSFSNAYQYSTALRQLTGLRVRRSIPGYQEGSESITPDTATLDNLMHLDIDEIASSTAGSITSPSDYSGCSRHSPGGSISGTPGWDPAAIGFSSKHPLGDTPGHLAGTEVIDSYFDAKKRQGGHRAPTSVASALLQQGQQAGRSSPTLEHRAPSRQVTIADRDDIIPKTEQKPRSRARDEKTTLAVHTAREKSPNRQTEVTSPRRPGFRTTPFSQDQADRRHSLLHSYGADFSSTFQSLPAATTPGLRTPGPLHSHGRSGPGLDTFDMPPPSERLLRTIIDSLPVQIFTAKPDTGELTWVNSKFLVYRGQDSRQAIQDPWRAIHPEDREEYMTAWYRSLKTGQQLQAKVRLQRFDGHYRWFYVRAAPLKDKRQSIRHWIGTNMDMHEQHIAEQNSARQQETAASEAKYRALANSSPQIVFAVTKTRGVIFCNSQWLTYSGQTEEQAAGIGFMDFVHPDDLGKCRLPAFNEDGSLPVNVPTTMPPEYRRSQSSSSSGGSSETSRTVTSPGHSPPSAMELPQAKLSKLASTGILKVSRDSDGRPSYSTEVRLRSKDGNYRWHLVRILLAEPVHQESGEEETWYGTCTDINDHKLLEQTLKETMDAKSRFLSNMSHEIRTPLNGITGMVNFLMDGNLNSEQMEHVNVIRSSAEGLRDLINDILDLSKVEAGMITLAWDWLHIRSLIEEVNDLTSSLAINKRLELNYIVDEDVPSMVKGDRFRIRQVLLNVIGNAIKFTKHGEVFVHCKMAHEKGAHLSEHQAMIRFEVKDTGSGFNEKQAEFLFKRFSQIDGSSTRQHGGTGLGLAISMQLVELHGGQMKANSVPGKGSTFTFSIKFGLPHEGDEPPPPPVTPGQGPRSTTAPPSLPTQSPTSTRAQAQQYATPQVLRRQRISDPPAPNIASPTTIFGSPSPSSASSDPSIRTGATSIRSERSSASSYVSEPSFIPATHVTLSPPPESRANRAESPAPPRTPAGLSAALAPLMYSILVVCPLVYSREATVKHIEMTLPKTIPHQITARGDLTECREMIGGDDPVIFTHIVLVLQEVGDILPFMDHVLKSPSHSSTAIVVVTDLMQKREIVRAAPRYDYEQLQKDGRLLFIFKPLKPSRIATIFDPQKERELSTDRAQDSAQQVAVTQKQVFDEMKRRLGDKGVRVLLVEDNQINQTVILKFLGKINATVKTVTDGIQCTDEVFAHPHDLYSIILCDLHMPNKDGYQTCKEIRRWERKNKYSYLPIIALSANVLGDVYAKCAEAGFNSYVTKPIDFKAFSRVLTNFLDPDDPSKPHEFMRPPKRE